MNSFCCIIDLPTFFQSDVIEFQKTTSESENQIHFNGGSFSYNQETKWKGEDGVQILNNRLTFLEGLIYEYKGRYISKNTLTTVASALSDSVDSVIDFNGDFKCAHIDKGRIFFATNKTKSKDIFYYYKDDLLIFGSHISPIVKALKRLSVPYNLDEEGAHLLLSYGYMLGDKTLISEIKRLEPGSKVLINKDGFNKKQYFAFKNQTDLDLSDEEWIKRLDAVFTKAIHNEFRKDLDHGFKHIVTLSGGMDSRMILAYAKKLGYENITNFCFSQHNHLEHQIAQEVSDHFGDHFVFVSLNNGNYLKDMKLPVLFNSGTVSFDGGSHALFAASQINFEEYGVLHTGNMGDGVLGTLLSGDIQVPPKGLSRHELLPIANKASSFIEKELKRFETDEIFQLYTRGFNFVFNGYRMLEQHTQFSSAFMDEDFVQLALSIPASLRKDRRLYLKWMSTKCPEATKNKIAATNVRPILSYSKYPLKVYPTFFKYGNLIKYRLKKNHVVSMIPSKKWLNENEKLRVTQDNFYKESMHLLDEYPNLQSLAAAEYPKKYLQRFKVITLLSVLHQFFGEKQSTN